ncbi:hypothetical protein L6452_09966 [Arctium lappa]|uniref:Uncharacterized protein n=1 Tax=Arctium lappa TaxID=4217 RepID=A0ACB9DMH0_ARCLA|nr:hypothetical protein L6452_09966 [Arctium lappa]
MEVKEMGMCKKYGITPNSKVFELLETVSSTKEILNVSIFVIWHYLSASAQMWASTGNEVLKGKITAVVSALAACQAKIKTGYLSAFPSEFFDRVEALQQIMAGLVDRYVLAGNSQALKMVTQMADYFSKRVQNVITRYTIERHWLYTITGDIRHLWLVHLFDKPCLLGLLALKIESRYDLGDAMADANDDLLSSKGLFIYVQTGDA